MTSLVRTLPRRGFFIACAVLLAIPFLALPSANAAAAGSLYSYTLNGGTSFQNQAEVNTSVALTPTGDWSQTPFGVRFDGNKTNQRSVAYAKPASGNTISVAGSQAVGASVMFKYEAPVGTTCFSDSHNVVQIGKFGTGLSQIKLQLSNCAKSQTNVYMQCRMAGAGSTINDKPVSGTLPLINGERYIATCVKAPDPATGKAIMELKTLRLDETNGHQVVSNAFEITRTGTIQSTDYLSVANKYPMPSYSSNTDQFNGEVAKVAFCKGVDIFTAKTCLASEVSEPAGPPAPMVDEVHYSYGNTADTVVFNWRGTEQTIHYGLTTDYGQVAIADNSLVTPVDITGPFREVALTGLQPNTTYHYKIGVNGTDATFTTTPTGSFRWVDIGDTKGSYCAPWMPGMHELIAAQQPNFVTHGGDISILNECGIPAAHAYYTDQEVWSRSAAFQPSWGNHEYGAPTPDAPFGTPADTMANYKGRSFITNAQTVSTDTPTRNTKPGCGQEVGSTTNTCMGEDWGWYRAGNVLFISYPEPSWTSSSLTEWRNQVEPMMAAAQADPTLDFIVTYGHRPAYTSSGEGPNTAVRAALDYLAQRYSPHANNPNGKYVLTFGHHAHGEEVLGPINGLTHVINAAGGQGFTSFTTIDPNSVFRMQHFAIAATDYNASAHRLDLRIICGSEYTSVKYNCDYGQVAYTKSFQRTDIPAEPQPSVLSTSLSDGVATIAAGQQLTYTATAANASGTVPAPGVQLSITLPQNVTVTNANGGNVSGNTVTWELGDLSAGQQVSRQVIVTVDSGASSVLTASSQLVSVACQNTGSDCDATDTTTISEPLPPPTIWQWVSNQGIEADMTGWTGKYGASSLISVTRDTAQAHSGNASIKVTGLSGASNLSSGFNDSPKWVSSATAGTTYVGSIWVKTSTAGQSVTLRLREWNGSTLLTDSKVTGTSTSTNWFEVTNQITAAQNGTNLAFAVYGNDVDAGEYFHVDDLSLISPL